MGPLAFCDLANHSTGFATLSKRRVSTRLPTLVQADYTATVHNLTQAGVHYYNWCRLYFDMGIMKPFKAPSLVGKNTLNSRPPPRLDEDRPTKKRRMSNAESSDDEAESVTAAAKVLKKTKTIPKFQPLVSKPVNTVANLNNSSSSLGDEPKVKTGQEGYYTVLW